jgi:hypothetical protein
METIYRTVKVSDRLPEKEGWYFVLAKDKQPESVYPFSDSNKLEWLIEVDAWLEEIEIPTDEEIEKSVKTTANMFNTLMDAIRINDDDLF